MDKSNNPGKPGYLSGALLGLCGAAGAGKDAAAVMMFARPLAFADALYAEVAHGFGCTVEALKDRATKELPQDRLAINQGPPRFGDFVFGKYGGGIHLQGFHTKPRSPRQILQWWGDYRRAQDPDYFVARTRQQLLDWDWAQGGTGAYVLTDCRFANEVAMLRSMGGHLVQVVRPGVAAGGTGHASDNDGSQFAPDAVLHNHGSLDDLRAAVYSLQAVFGLAP